MPIINNRYEYDPKSDFLGEGAFGRVYKAKDIQTDEYKALKITSSEGSGKLIREIERMKQFVHPNLIQCYESISIPIHNNLYGDILQEIGVMEYANAGDLSTYLEQTNPSTNKEELDQIIKDILEGLKYLDRNKIAHRDLKPANVLLHKQEDGRLITKLGDFGMAKNFGGNISASSLGLKGTVQYMAPEQFNYDTKKAKKRPSTKVDIWALGIILYKIYTQKHPLLDDTDEPLLITQKFNSFDVHQIDFKGVPKIYQKIIQSALIVDPKKRIYKAADFLRWIHETETIITKPTDELPKPPINAAHSIDQPPIQEITDPKKDSKSKKKNDYLALLLLLFVLASFSTIVYFFYQKWQTTPNLPPKYITTPTDTTQKEVIALNPSNKKSNKNSTSVSNKNNTPTIAKPATKKEVSKENEVVKEEAESIVQSNPDTSETVQTPINNKKEKEKEIPNRTMQSEPDKEEEPISSKSVITEEEATVNPKSKTNLEQINDPPQPSSVLTQPSSKTPIDQAIAVHPEPISKPPKTPTLTWNLPEESPPQKNTDISPPIEKTTSQPKPQPTPPQTTTVIPSSSKPENISCPSGMVFVPGGCFETKIPLGSEDQPCPSNPKAVWIESFCISKTEETYERFGEFVQDQPRNQIKKWFGGDCNPFKKLSIKKAILKTEYANYPVSCVSWEGAKEYLAWLSKHYPEYQGANLPSELQWEYAASDGLMRPESPSMSKNQLDKIANYYTGSDALSEVGQLEPSPKLGLYDLLGNVAEWCLDQHKGRRGKDFAIVRGGSANSNTKKCQITYRERQEETSFKDQHIGFRFIIPKEEQHAEQINMKNKW